MTVDDVIEMVRAAAHVARQDAAAYPGNERYDAVACALEAILDAVLAAMRDANG